MITTNDIDTAFGVPDADVQFGPFREVMLVQTRLMLEMRDELRDISNDLGDIRSELLRHRTADPGF